MSRYAMTEVAPCRLLRRAVESENQRHVRERGTGYPSA